MAKKQTFEAGMSELEALTARLETGDMTLDETMKTYEKGVTLAAQLQRQLEDSRKRIEQIDPETAEITPFDYSGGGAGVGHRAGDQGAFDACHQQKV